MKVTNFLDESVCIGCKQVLGGCSKLCLVVLIGLDWFLEIFVKRK